MDMRSAKRLTAGTCVNVPHMAIHEAYVVRLIEDPDPRIKLLVEVKTPPLGRLQTFNYRLIVARKSV